LKSHRALFGWLAQAERALKSSEFNPGLMTLLISKYAPISPIKLDGRKGVPRHHQVAEIKHANFA
jgi:hypothetical protein